MVHYLVRFQRGLNIFDLKIVFRFARDNLGVIESLAHVEISTEKEPIDTFPAKKIVFRTF